MTLCLLKGFLSAARPRRGCTSPATETHASHRTMAVKSLRTPVPSKEDQKCVPAAVEVLDQLTGSYQPDAAHSHLGLSATTTGGQPQRGSPVGDGDRDKNSRATQIDRRQDMSTVQASIQIPAYATGTWTIDPMHSDVSFKLRHLMVADVRGNSTVKTVR